MSAAKPDLIFKHICENEKVRVWQCNDRRWLDFDDGLIQSEIVLSQPEYLPLPLNRAMLAGVMFVNAIENVLLVGTGGGATARYFAARFPSITGDAIELSEVVSKVAVDYFDFPVDNNWQLKTADIRIEIKQCQSQYDLIIIDIAENKKTPDWILNIEFLNQCRQRLTSSGHLSVNLLVDNADQFLQALATIRTVFNQHTVCLSLPNHRNIVVLAFNNDPHLQVDKIVQRLDDLVDLWGIEFAQFYEQMLSDNPKGSGVI